MGPERWCRCKQDADEKDERQRDSVALSDDDDPAEAVTDDRHEPVRVKVAAPVIMPTISSGVDFAVSR
jgi:hypothetical protein